MADRRNSRIPIAATVFASKLTASTVPAFASALGSTSAQDPIEYREGTETLTRASCPA